MAISTKTPQNSAISAKNEYPISEANVFAYTIPTETPESDGTYEWNSTTLVLVELSAAGITGIGYTYADNSTALLIREKLFPLILGQNGMNISLLWEKMVHSIRNLGRPGI